MRRISLSLAIAAIALLVFGAFQMTASAASPNLGYQKITLAPGQKIAIPIRFWSLVYNKPLAGQFKGPQSPASDAVVKTVLSALLDGNAVAHPGQTQLAVWYAVDNTWHTDPLSNTVIAQQVVSDSLQIDLPTLPQNIPTLDTLVAQGKLVASFKRLTSPSTQSDQTQTTDGQAVLGTGLDSGQSPLAGQAASRQATISIQNVSKQAVTFMWVQGMTFVPSVSSNTQVLVVARDIPINAPGTVTPTNTPTTTPTAIRTKKPAATATPTRDPVSARQAQGTNTPTRTMTATPTTTATGVATQAPTETGVPTETAVATEVMTETVVATPTVASTASTTRTVTSTPTFVESLTPVATETTEPGAAGASGQLPKGGGEPFADNLGALGYVLAGFILLLMSGALEMYRAVKQRR